jgi:hypothetical protein
MQALLTPYWELATILTLQLSTLLRSSIAGSPSQTANFAQRALPKKI